MYVTNTPGMYVTNTPGMYVTNTPGMYVTNTLVTCERFVDNLAQGSTTGVKITEILSKGCEVAVFPIY